MASKSKRMTSYSQEVISDLVEGRLPWHQTKRIMSAYKDEDRFFSLSRGAPEAGRLEGTHPAADRQHLFIVQSGRRRITKCECGHDFGDYRKNWKLAAHHPRPQHQEGVARNLSEQRHSRSAMDGNPRIHLPDLRHLA